MPPPALINRTKWGIYRTQQEMADNMVKSLLHFIQTKGIETIKPFVVTHHGQFSKEKKLLADGQPAAIKPNLASTAYSVKTGNQYFGFSGAGNPYILRTVALNGKTETAPDIKLLHTDKILPEPVRAAKEHIRLQNQPICNCSEFCALILALQNEEHFGNLAFLAIQIKNEYVIKPCDNCIQWIIYTYGFVEPVGAKNYKFVPGHWDSMFS